MGIKGKEDISLIAHLLRRAGFGGPYDQLEHYAEKGYEATVEELLHPEEQPAIEEDLLMRFEPTLIGGSNLVRTYWVYRMINSRRPLEEKATLFWHGIHCAAQSKSYGGGGTLRDYIEVFRWYGLGSFRELLIQLAKNPAMIYFLDNQINHRGSINENWSRELLELFSMGVGNYTEADVQEAARAFTGWTIAPMPPMRPFGNAPMEFLYDTTDHDEGEKVFLGDRGRFNGEDIIDIICRQPATAHFISRHMYNFFVADEPPVPQWPDKPPRDPQAIELLSKVYFESQYDIRSMLRALFNSDFFKKARFSKVRSPAEVVVGTVRLMKNYDTPGPGLVDVELECEVMGQEFMNPPSVEGWHTGKEWIDTGTLVERVNYLAKTLGDFSQPGIVEMVQRLSASGRTLTAEEFVDGCLEQLGCMEVAEDTMGSLLEHAQRRGEIDTQKEDFPQRTVLMLQLIAATREFQMG